MAENEPYEDKSCWTSLVIWILLRVMIADGDTQKQDRHMWLRFEGRS